MNLIKQSRCPYCHDEVKRGLRPEVCPSCHALHHVECWAEHKGCSACNHKAEVRRDNASCPPYFPIHELPTQEELAYQIWIEKGKPEGEDEANWHGACTRLNELKKWNPAPWGGWTGK